MREIKFRAWDGKEMHENVVIVDGKAYKRSRFGMIYAEGSKAGTPMKWTGLLDKNGKEIYEEDIIKWTKRKYTDCSREEIESEEVYIGVLKWSETMYGVYTNKGQGYLLMPYYIESDEFEVMGNIYEHSHLLEGEKK